MAFNLDIETRLPPPPAIRSCHNLPEDALLRVLPCNRPVLYADRPYRVRDLPERGVVVFNIYVL